MVPLPRLIVITDWTLPREVLLARLEAALGAGPEVAIQHRHKEAPVRAFLEEARLLRELCDRGGNALFVNGRLDVALLVDAHLHLPANGLRPEDVRAHLPAGRWISVAVHSEAEAAAARGVDLALVSPVFRPLSKADDRAPLGPEGFETLAARLPCPAYALGGVTAEGIRTLRSASGCAVIGAVLHAKDPRAAAMGLLGLAWWSTMLAP